METYSDLLIQSGGSDVEEGSISDGAEERNREQEATCDQGGGGLTVENGLAVHHGSGPIRASFSDRCLVPVSGASVQPPNPSEPPSVLTQPVLEVHALVVLSAAGVHHLEFFKQSGQLFVQSESA